MMSEIRVSLICSFKQRLVYALRIPGAGINLRAFFVGLFSRVSCLSSVIYRYLFQVLFVETTSCLFVMFVPAGMRK
jgi:hypothetical protein